MRIPQINFGIPTSPTPTAETNVLSTLAAENDSRVRIEIASSWANKFGRIDPTFSRVEFLTSVGVDITV
jgi:hypothetical protein